MKIVIEIPHQSPASVNLWTDEAFNKECKCQASICGKTYAVWTPESAAESFDYIPAELEALFAKGHKEVVEHGDSRTEFEPVGEAPNEETFGWQHWISDLHLGICFDTVAEAEEWAANWKAIGGHQWPKVISQLNILKESI